MEYFKWVNDLTITFMSRGYLVEGQSVEDRVKEITDTFERNLVNMGMEPALATNYAKKFYGNMAMGYYSLATPVWTNYGSPRGYPVSCFGSVADDSMPSIAYTSAETKMLMAKGGGTSGSYDLLRPRGAAIQEGRNGESSGAVHFMKDAESLTEVVSQGSARRGFFTPYLNADHPDVMEFLTIGDEGSAISTLTTGVVISDDFIERAKVKGSHEQKVLIRIHKARSEKGHPYIVFQDNANNARPDVYKRNNMPILASNMCVAPETEILTSEGCVPISKVAGTKQSIWNGQEWSKVDVVKTGENQKLVKVVTSTGQELECTEYHKWYLSDGSEVRTNELKVGDKLIKFDLPVISPTATKSLSNPYTQGFYSGDGCLVGGVHRRIYLYGEKKNLLNALAIADGLTVQEDQDRIYFNSCATEDKTFVPKGNYSNYSKLMWLAGLLDSDGTVLNNNNSLQLQITSINKKFLQDVQLMLQELGCKSSLSLSKESGIYDLPRNDGSGTNYPCECKDLYRINISTVSVGVLLGLGLKLSRLDLSKFKNPNRESSRFITVEGVIDTGRSDDTYCFTEPKRNMGMFNGILTGQCAEIMLPSSTEETFVCVLSSMNLVEYDSWKDTDAVQVLTLFLDTVAEEFINKLEADKLATPPQQWFLERVLRFTKRHRALGLGALGWATALQKRMLPFESIEAARLNVEIFKQIDQETKSMTHKMASWFGEPELLIGTGRRNTTLTAVAPTKSSSFILGQVSQGIEPEFANAYLKKVAKSTILMRNPVLVDLLETKGLNTPEIWDDIEKHAGSVQHADYLTKEEKDVFKTIHEIPVESILYQAAARQPYTEQGQSLSFPLPPTTTAKEHNRIMLLARDLGIKSLYYLYNMNAAQMAARELAGVSTDCVACSS